MAYVVGLGQSPQDCLLTVSQRNPSAAFISKPSGYSFFPKELVPMPRSWVATTCNLVHSNLHSSGGHFAVSLNSDPRSTLLIRSQAFEKPQELLADFEEYARLAWKQQGGKL